MNGNTTLPIGQAYLGYLAELEAAGLTGEEAVDTAEDLACLLWPPALASWWI
jgi:hypothetical protein